MALPPPPPHLEPCWTPLSLSPLDPLLVVKVVFSPSRLFGPVAARWPRATRCNVVSFASELIMQLQSWARRHVFFGKTAFNSLWHPCSSTLVHRLLETRSCETRQETSSSLKGRSYCLLFCRLISGSEVSDLWCSGGKTSDTTLYLEKYTVFLAQNDQRRSIWIPAGWNRAGVTAALA